MEAIVNDALFDKILFMASMIGGVILGGIGFFISPYFAIAGTSTIWMSGGGFVVPNSYYPFTFQC